MSSASVVAKAACTLSLTRRSEFGFWGGRQRAPYSFSQRSSVQPSTVDATSVLQAGDTDITFSAAGLKAMYYRFVDAIPGRGRLVMSWNLQPGERNARSGRHIQVAADMGVVVFPEFGSPFNSLWSNYRESRLVAEFAIGYDADDFQRNGQWRHDQWGDD